jgi:hypothetical protein
MVHRNGAMDVTKSYEFIGFGATTQTILGVQMESSVPGSPSSEVGGEGPQPQLMLPEGRGRVDPRNWILRKTWHFVFFVYAETIPRRGQTAPGDGLGNCQKPSCPNRPRTCPGQRCLLSGRRSCPSPCPRLYRVPGTPKSPCIRARKIHRNTKPAGVPGSIFR